MCEILVPGIDSVSAGRNIIQKGNTNTQMLLLQDLVLRRGLGQESQSNDDCFSDIPERQQCGNHEEVLFFDREFLALVLLRDPGSPKQPLREAIWKM